VLSASSVRVLLLCSLFATAASRLAAAPSHHVLLVTLDGLRWQEVFRGAEAALIDTEHGGVPKNALERTRQAYVAATPEEARRKLMPFLWSEVAVKGQLFGNRDRGSVMRVANGEWFSYPGYNELLCGSPDPLITSNAPIPNRNVTVLEWLNGRPGFEGLIAACVTWHVLPAILNVGRSRLPVWVSSQNPSFAARSPRFAEIDRWMRDVPIKADDEHYDAFGFHAALETLAVLQPRVLYVALGEPDTNAHARRYAAYLESITRCDRFIRELWERLQSLERYRGRTTLIVTTDHGRGRTPQDWTSHNKKTPGSDETWLAILGPNTPARGERTGHEPILSAQVAATVAAALGQDYTGAAPAVAPPVPGIFIRSE
jgi:hypothetical protein